MKLRLPKGFKQVDQLNVPDIESLEIDKPFPKTIEVNQAYGKGNRKRTYYSFESWAKYDLSRRDLVELVFFEPNSKKRWFFSYVVKSILAGVGYFLERRCMRYNQQVRAVMDSETRDDLDLTFKYLTKKYNGHVPQHIRGYVIGAFFMCGVDNAYNTFYKELKQELTKKRRKA